eukprot:SAG31_NODE_779_length_12158_cov_8.740194_6_plen_97_part_00
MSKRHESDFIAPAEASVVRVCGCSPTQHSIGLPVLPPRSVHGWLGHKRGTYIMVFGLAWDILPCSPRVPQFRPFGRGRRPGHGPGAAGEGYWATTI